MSTRLRHLLYACACAASAHAATPDVHIDSGRIRGAATGVVASFKGIPFARRPLETSRFAPPEPAASWSGVLDATEYRSACPQLSRFGLTDASDDEDCLYLNVTVPASTHASAKKTPVLVWIVRTMTVGMLALLVFGLCEQSPARLPAGLARWVLQLLGVVAAVPIGAFAAYWLTTGDLENLLRLSGYEPLRNWPEVVAPLPGGSDRPTGPSDLVGKLERLAALHARGALTEAEFAAAKAAVIAGR